MCAPAARVAIASSLLHVLLLRVACAVPTRQTCGHDKPPNPMSPWPPAGNRDYLEDMVAAARGFAVQRLNARAMVDALAYALLQYKDFAPWEVGNVWV